MRYIVYRWGFSCLDFLLEVSISWIYLLSPYNWLCHFYTSHYLMPLSCSCMDVLTLRFSMYAFCTQIYRYTCAYPYTPFGIRHTTRWGVLTLLDPYIQISELVDSSGCWSEWRSESVNHWQTIWSPIIQALLLDSRIFLFWLWAFFCTVHYCKLFVFSHLHHIGDVIFM